MPVVAEPFAAQRWLNARLSTPTDSDSTVYRVITYCQVVWQNGELAEFMRPNADADSDEMQDYYASWAQPLMIALSCTDRYGSPVIVLMKDCVYRILLESKRGDTERQLLYVQTRVKAADGVGAKLVHRLRVSGAESASDGKRKRDPFIEVTLTSLQQQKNLKKSMPGFKFYHLDPLVKTRSFEQSGATMYLAELGVEVGGYISLCDARKLPEDTASVPVLECDLVEVVEAPKNFDVPLTLGWDIETTALSPKNGEICMISAAFFCGSMKAVLELVVCKQGGALMPSYANKVFSGGLPDSHCIALFRSEASMLIFFLRNVLPRAPITYGYNSYKFDAMWIKERVAKWFLTAEWFHVHWLPGSRAQLMDKTMESRAMSSNTFYLILTGLTVHADLLLHAWKHCRYTPGNLKLDNVVWTTSQLTKASFDHTQTRRITGNPAKYPAEFMALVAYGGQDSTLLMALANPRTTAEQVLGPLGVQKSDLRRVLRVADFRDLANFVEFPDHIQSIDARRTWLRTSEGIETVLGEPDEPEGIDDAMFMLPDGTRVGRSGVNPDVWKATRAGLDCTNFIMQVAALVKIRPQEVLPYGQQKRMTSLIFVNGVTGIDGLRFVFDQKVETNDVGTFEGGAVETLPAGLWNYVCYCDASAMYPNLIRHHALSPESPTGLPPEKMHLREELLLPAIVNRLLAFRREKEALKKQALDEFERTGDTFFEEQSEFLGKGIAAMKGTINSVFGFCGSPSNAFGSTWHDIASSITRNGREQITAVKDVLNALDFATIKRLMPDILQKHDLWDKDPFRMLVVYGDTDSKAPAILREDNGLPATHLSVEAALELFDYICTNMTQLGEQLGIQPVITLKMGIEDLYTRMLGCNQSKTYAGLIAHYRQGKLETRLVAKGFAVVRGDRWKIVVTVQKQSLNIALSTQSREEARDAVLRLTYDTIQTIREAGSTDWEDMGEEARKLLPFTMLKVWSGGPPSDSAQASVAHIINRGSVLHVSSGDKVAFAISPGSGNVRDRAFPFYDAMCAKNPRGRRQDYDLVIDALKSAQARVIAACCSVNNINEARRIIDAYSPGQKALFEGQFAPVRAVVMTQRKKREKGTKLEQAAKRSKKMDDFIDVSGTFHRKSGGGLRDKSVSNLSQTCISTFFQKS